MGAIDRPLAAKGAAMFKADCASCHNMAPYERTDPAYTEALLMRMTKPNALTETTLGGRKVVPAAELFFASFIATVTVAMKEAGLTEQETLEYHGYRFTKDPATGKLAPYAPKSLTDLKAGPLAGLWATGPYLHNGSVATVYELLSAPEERREVFWAGGREVDRARLGYVADEAPGLFRFDTSLRGNGAQGHRFPAAGLDHDGKMAIIEYLKTQ